MADTGTTARRVTVVYNPTKTDDLEGVRATMDEVCERLGWSRSEWVETTETETGEKQAREAVEAGADLVCSYGGDGTVRAVATGLLGSGVPLGLLPGGTGNLLARNLELPVDDLAQAAAVALGGRDQHIDVGLLRAGGSGGTEPGEGDEPQEGEDVFLVMCGIGLDGDIMADAPEGVKKVMGWPAYIVSGLRHLGDRGMSLTVEPAGDEQPEMDGAEAGPSRIGTRHGRTVVIGNCGTLQGGVRLLPDASVDDGILDTVVMAPRTAAGWVSVLASLVTRSRAGHPRVSRMRSRTVKVVVDHPRTVEVDGDPGSEFQSIAARVLPRALAVRVG